MLLSLVLSLITLDRPEQGARVLDQAFPNHGEDVEVLTMHGRLRLAMGDGEGAVRLLEHAVKLAPDRPAPLIALSAAQSRTGRHAEAQASVKRIVRRFGYLRKPRRGGRQRPTILVLNPPPRQIEDPGASIQELHFRFNYPSNFQARMADEYHFLSLFGTTTPDLRPWEADEPTVVLNNLVDETEMNRPGSVERVRRLIDEIGVPVINPPEAVIQVSREKNAETLAGIPGLRLPRIARYRLTERDIDATAADIEKTIGYPVILRHPAAHASHRCLRGEGPKSIYLASNADEACAALTESGWPEFFAIEFVDLRKKGGWYRRLRAVCIGEVIIIYHGGYSSEWVVPGCYRTPEDIAFYRAHPESLAHISAILKDPKSELGHGCLEVLQQIRERIPLDIFGIDFDVDDVGQVVLFQATAAMKIQRPRAGVPPDLRLPMEPFGRIQAAFHHLVARRITERRSEADEDIKGVVDGSRSDRPGSASGSSPPALRPVRSIGSPSASGARARGMDARKLVVILVLIVIVLIRLFTSLAESWN